MYVLLPLGIVLGGQWACLKSESAPGEAEVLDADAPLPAPVERASSRRKTTTIFDRPLHRLSVEFKVHRISSVPGSFGEGSELWKIASIPLADAESALRLASNGFRVGIGRESDRQSLVAFLEGLVEPRTALDQVIPDSTRHVDIELGACAPQLTVFLYDEQGRLHGEDYMEATARFKLAFQMRSSNLREVSISLFPELEEPPGPPKWVIGPDNSARQVAEERKHAFNQLAFSARIPEGGFLVLAATAAVYESPLLAKPFFVKRVRRVGQAMATERESIYVISPMVRSNVDQSETGRVESPGVSQQEQWHE